MKISGKVVVPLIVVVVGVAIAYVSMRRAALLVPGGEAPGVGEQMPSVPAMDLDGGELPVWTTGEASVLVVLRGFAGYVDEHCVEQMRALAAARKQWPKVRVIALYPGADADREFAQFGAALSRAGVKVSGVDWGLDPELHVVGALDAYGDPALPCVWAVDANGVIRYRAYGIAADRPNIQPAFAALAQ